MHRPRAGRRHRDEFLLIPRVSTEGHPPSSRRTNQRHGRNEPSGRGRKGGPVRGGGSVQGHRTPRRNLWQGGLGGRERAGPTVRTPRCNLCSAAGAGARARVRVRARCACARDEGAHSMKRTATRLCCVNDTKSANSSSEGVSTGASASSLGMGQGRGGCLALACGWNGVSSVVCRVWMAAAVGGNPATFGRLDQAESQRVFPPWRSH